MDGQVVEAQVRELRTAGAASVAKSERAPLPRSLWCTTAIGRAPLRENATTSLGERQLPAPVKERHHSNCHNRTVCCRRNRTAGAA
jgi:hypothetical protein